MTLALLFLLAAARGADPVLHDGAAEQALAQAARDTGRPVEELRATTLTELLRGRPTVLRGGGSVEVCARVPASVASFDEALGKAEGAMAYLEYDAALKELDEAAALLGCLSQPADPVSAARMYFLRGLVFFFSQETMAARGAWVQAHRFAPGLAWDDNFPPDGKELFEEARTAVGADAPTKLSLVPPLDDETLWIDGREATVSEGLVTVAAGDHLVQYGASGVTTVRLTLDPGAEATLVFPHAVHDADLAWVVDPAGRPVLSEVLSAALGPDAVVYAVHEGQTWSGTAGSSDWVALAVVAGPTVPGTPEPKKRTWYVASSGAALAVLGGAGAIASWYVAQDAADEAASATTSDDFKDQDQRYRTARTTYWVSMGVGVAGVAIGAAGIAIPVAAGVSVGPHPAGPGVILRIRR